jgi:hypothetical protein
MLQPDPKKSLLDLTPANIKHNHFGIKTSDEMFGKSKFQYDTQSIMQKLTSSVAMSAKFTMPSAFSPVAIGTAADLIDHHIPGMKSYLNPKIIGTSLAFDIYARTKDASENGKRPGAALFCASVGAVSTHVFEAAVDTAIMGLATEAIVISGGIAVLPAGAFAANVYIATAEVAPYVGNLAEKTCHDGLDYASKLKSAIRP